MNEEKQHQFLCVCVSSFRCEKSYKVTERLLAIYNDEVFR